MNRFSKALLLGLGLTGAMLAGGCASGYYDDDGYYRGDHTTYYRDHDGHTYRDSDRDTERVRVCDADGDNCHWEYRRR